MAKAGLQSVIAAVQAKQGAREHRVRRGQMRREEIRARLREIAQAIALGMPPEAARRIGVRKRPRG